MSPTAADSRLSFVLTGLPFPGLRERRTVSSIFRDHMLLPVFGFDF